MNSPITKLMLLSDLMGHMPGIKTRSTRDLIKGWEWKSGVRTVGKSLKAQKRQPVVIGEFTIEPDVLFEMYYSDGSQWGKDTVSPRAARILIELYLAGRLETKTKPVPREAIGQVLIDYAQSELSLKDILNAGKEDEARKKAERLVRLNRPLDEIPESELTQAFLHDLFMYRKITNGSLIIAGVKVSKMLTRSSSNSGKSHDWNESFTWVGTDGEHRQVGIDGAFSTNRRNDADRNWGLGRE